MLLQSGPDKERWADSMECYCYLRDVQDLLSDGKHHMFGAMVEHHPISAKDLPILHQCCPKVLPGIFLGYVLYAGGIWKGDILVADIEDLEEMDASELYARRLNAKEGRKEVEFSFSRSKMEQSKSLGEDSV